MKQISQAGQSYPVYEKKSKFIASAAPINSEEDAIKFLQRITAQHAKANHNCFAYRIYNKAGIVMNESDDGEPSGTAGSSILFVLEKQEIFNTIIVVTRYFGGIKLGKGGLTRAYSNSAINILQLIGLVDLL